MTPLDSSVPRRQPNDRAALQEEAIHITLSADQLLIDNAMDRGHGRGRSGSRRRFGGLHAELATT